MKKLMDGLVRRQPDLATFSAFVPHFVMEHILASGGTTVEEEAAPMRPLTSTLEGAVMIVDLSGYTKLSEKLGRGELTTISPTSQQSKRHLRSSSTTLPSDTTTPSSRASIMGGKNNAAAAFLAQRMRYDKHEMASYGSEVMRRILNNYFGKIIDVIETGQGDVIRVAGDAIIASFVPFDDRRQCTSSTLKYNSQSDNEAMVTNALKTAVACMSDFNGIDVMGVKLHLHIAIGVGRIMTFIVGGVNDNWQHVVAGGPFTQIKECLPLGGEGDIVVSALAWAALSDASRSDWRSRHIANGMMDVTALNVDAAKELTSHYRISKYILSIAVSLLYILHAPCCEDVMRLRSYRYVSL